jgi:hypothetical protein
MRWHEIVTEELSFVQMAKSYIMDILAPLKAQGVKAITVQQILDQLKGNPDFQGTDLSGDLVNQSLRGMDEYTIEPDPQTNQLSVMISNPEAGRQVGHKQAEKDQKSIHNAAMRTIDKKEG